MGIHWLPDPPVGSSLSDEISAPSVIIVDSDNDDGIDIAENDIEAIANVNEYRLLTDGDNLTDGEGAEYSDDGENENVLQTTDDTLPTDYSSDEQPTEEIPTKSNSEEPRDIAIDCDKVRAAMANITLPASATPSWAASIPDSEWGSYLQTRIRSLQEQSSKSPSSQ
ncbi:uncharacterized protein LOC135840266 [Planococcus citri]|uniref:uncharacterized protein LOC135840266 n=1 Tax=Planococcus citri TaxID=170843 RepID=UPI0031F7D669